jgi:dinuclear metal center YbgI/SA1388 family protein
MHFNYGSAFFFDMTVQDIMNFLEQWAPKQISWEKDNVGLQVGNPDIEVKNILLTLDVEENVIKRAIEKNCTLIISHHPLLFKPLKSIDTKNNKTASLTASLIKNNISLYSAHTNLDFTKDGVSFQLAKTLDLQNIKFLSNLSSNQYKLNIFVPETHLDAVSEAIFQAGGGIIGEYSHCAFRLKGTGSFKGSDNSDPALGEKGKYETVEEIKLETLVDAWKLSSIMNAVKKVHPYEEVAYDVFKVENENVNYGAGAVGELKNPLQPNEFLEYISSKLKIKNFRYSNGINKKIKKVAVCGGSGIDLINQAISRNADAFITADIKYHAFQDAQGKILLVDAGHYETEIFSLDELKKRLEDFLRQTGKKVFKHNGSTNPIKFYNKRSSTK